MKMSALADIFYFAMPVFILPEWEVFRNTKKTRLGRAFYPLMISVTRRGTSAMAMRSWRISSR